MSLATKCETTGWVTARDLAFIQNEHQHMLRGLHNEIESLQQRCADSQRQLVLQGLVPNKEETLKAAVEQLRAQLIEKSQECQVLKTELKDKDETIEDLEKRMKEQEERYWDDVSARNLIVVRLRKEVQEKSSTVARLSALLRAQTGREPEKVGTCKLATARTRWDSKGLLPNETTGNLYRKLMDFGPASNRNLSVPTSSQPSSISRQILDKYCRLSQPSYLPNVNVPKRQQQQQPPPSELPGTDTHNRKPQTLQIRKNFVERRLDRDLVNNVRPWADPQLINADGPSTT